MDEVVKLQGKLNYRVEGVPYHKSFAIGDPAVIPYGRIITEKQNITAGITYQIRIVPDRRAVLDMEAFSVSFTLPMPVVSCFVNGFQSWTESMERDPASAQKPMNPLFSHWISKYQLKQYGDQSFNPYSGKAGEFAGFTYGYLRHPDHSLTLAASLDESSGYTIIRFIIHEREELAGIRIEKECSGQRLDKQDLVLSFFLGTGGEQEIFDNWQREAMAGMRPVKPVMGWTSWYKYYEKISEKIIQENLKAFSERGIPIGIFQIDDGWQAAVGDWLTVKETFPGGMASLAREIRKAGYSPGLWIAPFAAEESSALCRDHADWILRDEHGPVKAGYNPFNWSGNFYGLDISHPEVREYLRLVFHTIVNVWGFQMIKADFLYAAALAPRGGKSRGSIMYEGVKFLREMVGERLLLGCGVPLGSTFGQVDYCRIGSDVGPVWEDRRLKALRYPERVSTRSSLSSTIGRSHLNSRFFLNDPDVIILRDSSTKLTAAQKQVLFFVNNLFGSLVFTSDNPDEYTEKQLQLYYSSFPPVEKSIISSMQQDGLHIVEFRIKKRQYIACINLSGKPGKYNLPGDAGTAWFNEISGIISGGGTRKIRGIEAHCWAKVPVSPWRVIGTTGRLFPGSEIEQVFREDDEMTITFREGTLLAGDVVVRLPKGTSVCMINNNSALIYEEHGVTVGRASLI